MYLDRFNLRPIDIELGRETPLHQDSHESAEYTWSVYLKKLLLPSKFYCLSLLRSDRFFLVADNRSLPGRDVVGQDEAHGRPLAVVWFEKTGESIEGIIVSPCNEAIVGQLELLNATIAELSRSSGYFPAIAANTTARAEELLHEQAFLSHDILCYVDLRLDEAEKPWQFILSEPKNAEDVFFAATPNLFEHTKMGLARLLQRRDNLTDLQRKALLGVTKERLLDIVGRRNPGRP